MLDFDSKSAGQQKIIASRELTVENTTFCGAKCIMCPRDEYSKAWSHMDDGLFRDVLDQAADLGITSLDLCGFGDPFMDPGYEGKLRYVRESYPHIRLYTSTTGHLLHQKNLPWIAELFDTLKISFYGNSKESYEAIHQGVLKFEKVRENVENLLAIPRDKRTYVILTFLVFEENEHEIQDWIDYWEPIADEVLVWKPHNYGGAESIEELSFRTSARDVKTYRSCGRPFTGNPFVRTNGDVSVCCFDFNHKLVVGNLKLNSLVEILDGPALANVKSVHTTKEFDDCGLLCEGCDQIYSREDALLYTTNESRKTDQPTTHPDHIVKLAEGAPTATL